MGTKKDAACSDIRINTTTEIAYCRNENMYVGICPYFKTKAFKKCPQLEIEKRKELKKIISQELNQPIPPFF